MPLEYPFLRGRQGPQYVAGVVETKNVHHDDCPGGVTIVDIFPSTFVDVQSRVGLRSAANVRLVANETFGLVARSAVTRFSSIIEFRPTGLHQVPLCAELIESLAMSIAGIVVADVVVQRMTVVGQLRSPVRAVDAAQGRALGPARRIGLRRYRRPDAGTGRGARRGGRGVALEQVQGPAGAVDQRRSRAKRCAADRDRGRRRTRRSSRRGRSGPVAGRAASGVRWV